MDILRIIHAAHQSGTQKKVRKRKPKKRKINETINTKP